jgi:hypothetical protein
MTRALYGRLFSTKTLAVVAVAALSLQSMGSAFAQAAMANINPPAYGTTWAAAKARSPGLDGQNMASEHAKTARVEAPKTTESVVTSSSHRTGG